MTKDAVLLQDLSDGKKLEREKMLLLIGREDSKEGLVERVSVREAFVAVACKMDN